MGDGKEGPARLREAIRAALDTAGRSGRFGESPREVVASALAALDDRLSGEPTGVHFRVERVPDHCLAVMESNAPNAVEVVGSFMHGAGARPLGPSRAWLLPLSGIPVTRWARALRRVLAAERRSRGLEESAFPARLTMVWSEGPELAMVSVE